jgi:hypothetical protein
MIIMAPPYQPFHTGLAAPSSPTSNEKIYPNFARMASSAPSEHHRQQNYDDDDDDDDDDTKKPAAVDLSKLPPGVAPNDVLCGRDKVSHAHIGNKYFRQIIEDFRAIYQNADCRDQKTNITCSVISKIQNRSGRFLKLNEESGIWEEVGEQYAREKVSHALRSAKDPNRPKVKKPRKTKKYIPTQEEDAAFKEALEQQQQIFQDLIENHVDSEGGSDNEEDDGDNNTTNKEDASENQDDEDWDFYQ